MEIFDIVAVGIQMLLLLLILLRSKATEFMSRKCKCRCHAELAEKEETIILLEKELEEERQAASSAANEAMEMIRSLQLHRSQLMMQNKDQQSEFERTNLKNLQLISYLRDIVCKLDYQCNDENRDANGSESASRFFSFIPKEHQDILRKKGQIQA